MKYEIKGNDFPVVVCTVENGESMITESGSMAWMSPNMQMETTTNGGVGKAIGRMFSGEKLFVNRYTALGDMGTIAFTSSFAGDIMPLDLSDGRQYICQKSAFLAGTENVQLSAEFTKKFSSGLFGGEGFILQRLSGNGIAFIEIDGAAIKYNLKPGQQIVVSTGHLAMMSASCQYEVKTINGAKNILLGGEGIFNTIITGPGEVVLQTMPVFRLASSIRPYVSTSTS